MADDPYNTWARAFASECTRIANGNLDPHQAWVWRASSTASTRTAILLR